MKGITEANTKIVEDPDAHYFKIEVSREMLCLPVT